MGAASNIVAGLALCAMGLRWLLAGTTELRALALALAIIAGGAVMAASAVIEWAGEMSVRRLSMGGNWHRRTRRSTALSPLGTRCCQGVDTEKRSAAASCGIRYVTY